MSSTKQPQPPSIIDPILASQRLDYFTSKKKAVLDDIIGKPEIDHIRYEVPVFLQLLNFLTNGPRKYSGLRVYFASHVSSATDSGNQYIPAGCENNLTLIYVPTLAVTKGTTVFNGDDLDNCFIIANNQLVRLSNAGNNTSGKDTASNWISHYQERLPDMNQDGARVTRNAAFNDTKSLWYRMAIFVGSPELGQPGLVSYIQDLLKDPVNPLSAIVVRMGCYTPTDKNKSGVLSLEYQMTLLFELHLQNNPDPDPVVLVTQQRPAVHADSATVGTGLNPESDTGFPCPPDECLGSLLPAAS